MQRTRKTWRVAIVVLALVAGLLAAPPSGAAETDFSLGLGDEIFLGPYAVDRAEVIDPSLCNSSVGECPEWSIGLEGGGAGLRVALSALFQNQGDVRAWSDFIASAPEMIFGLQILNEEGAVLAEGSTGETSTGYAVELFLKPAPAGVYKVRVIPKSVTNMAFRLRAKLEGESIPGRKRTVLTPNLRAIPPFEISFYSPTASYGPGVPVPAPQASCMAEEIEEAVENERPVPRACLRYSMGFENAGNGIFWLSVFCPTCEFYYDTAKPIGDLICGAFGCEMGEVGGDPGVSRDFPLTQIRTYSDGTCCQVESLGSAGTGRFHAAHGHLHYQNAYYFELLRINDKGWSPGNRRPKHLDLVGPGGKLGLFPGDEKMTDWERFFQAPRGSCPVTPDHCGPGMGNSPLLGTGEPKVNAGWGDIYEWNRGGNYVDFPADELGAPLAGYYVLRGTSDPDRLIIETNEKDNVAYGFIEVRSDGAVRLLERGYGSDPWDRAKSVATSTP